MLFAISFDRVRFLLFVLNGEVIYTKGKQLNVCDNKKRGLRKIWRNITGKTLIRMNSKEDFKRIAMRKTKKLILLSTLVYR